MREKIISQFFSFPLVTEMFHFTRCALRTFVLE